MFKILAVDDEPFNLDLIELTFSDFVLILGVLYLLNNTQKGRY